MNTAITTESAIAKIRYDSISNSYDLINRIFSFGLMETGRREVANWLSNRGSIRVLDVACGTGNQILSFFSTKLNIISVNGIDLSEQMIKRAKQKIAHSKINNYVFLEKGDAHDLRFEDDFFDAVTISYSLRDLDSITRFFDEAHRVLKTDCPLIILYQRNPTHCGFKYLYLWYLRYIFCTAAGYISGNPEVYKTMFKNICSQQETNIICKYMKTAGFHKVNAYNLCAGSAFFISGKKRIH
jgi:demethylmenaquinone methyltransferase / 2-methoxy-6-polyprenyl-1,4-benzoquinol methylase